MRLLGLIALCLVLLASLIYGFGRRQEIQERFTDRLVEFLPEETAAVDSVPPELPAPNAAQQVVIAMREAGQLNAASGFPGYTKATFPLPQRASPVAGQIELDISGGMQISGEGRFRVSVNGVRRKEIVMDPGRMRRKLVVPLNAREMSGKAVTVTVSVEGRAPEAECSSDWRGGVVVQILPSSHMRLDLKAPLSDPADLLLVAGAPLTLDWPEATAGREADRAKLFELAYRLTARQHQLFFATQAGQGVDLDSAALDALNARETALQPVVVDPRDLAVSLGSRRSLTFEAETQWRLPFDRRQLDGGTVGALDLALAYDAAGSDAGWLLSVFLNNRLVHSEELDAASGRFDQRVDLPYAEQVQLNEILVKLASAEELSGHCVRARPAVAEITRATLLPAADVAAAPVDEVQALFSSVERIGTIELSPSLDALGAQVALDTLVSLFPFGSLDLSDAAGDASQGGRLSVVAHADMEDALSGAEGRPGWAVYANPDHPDGYAVAKLSAMAAVGADMLPRAVLFIEAAPRDGSAVATQ